MNTFPKIKNFYYPYKKLLGTYKGAIPVKFKSPTFETTLKWGIIDTGSDFVLIKHNLAKHLGLQVKNWIDGSSASGNFKQGKVKVDLIIGHANKEQKLEKIEIMVSEKNNNPIYPLIGRKPLFDWYNVYFNNEKKRCELTSIK